MQLELKRPEDCRFDEISLGEIMLRLDPGAGRIKNSRSFTAWEGGGEYNVARGLRRCFGLRTAVITALADNEVGRLIEDFILQGGVDTSFIKWMSYDGIGRNVRNGLNFTERGYGIRGAVGVSDRGNTAASQLRAEDVDWDYIFGKLGENGSFMFVDCIGLLPYCYCPHFISERWQSFGTAVIGCRVSGIGAEDGAALIFKDGHFSAMCGNDGGSVFYFDKDNGFAKSDITEDASALDI